jgi:RNA polymerase sigma-70 factor (ECF subfamily)
MAWHTTQPSLLARLRDPADHAAWREFDRCYGDLIVRYCRSRGLQQSDAEDVRQVVLMNLASAMRGFEYSPARGKFRSYLGRVVRNTISRAAGRPDRRMGALDNGGLTAVAEDDESDARWEREWTHHHLRTAMQTIRRTFDPRSVAAFDRLLAGASTRVVAEEMDMTVEAVHKAKQRIRNRLRALVAAQVADEDRVDA